MGEVATGIIGVLIILSMGILPIYFIIKNAKKEKEKRLSCIHNDTEYIGTKTYTWQGHSSGQSVRQVYRCRYCGIEIEK
ncbi:MAG: hypothetical protein FWG72_02395 [Oscillospiraceae bacterium]|nr:hypothetical protein [Oscillospiraceae bacterium]